MKDHEPPSTSREDAATTIAAVAPQSSKQRPERRADDGEPDRAIRLAAEVLGITIKRANEIVNEIGGVEALAFASESDLIGASLTPRRARLVRAAFELVRDSIGGRPRHGQRLVGAWEVWTHMRARLGGIPVEEFWAIAVDVRHRVLLDSMIARGSLTSVEVHPRDVFRALIKAGAAAVIFCHNHPSGDPEPSRQDVDLTARLREVGELCGITVLDHLVVAAGGYVSLAERGWR
jgi:DNA repair protein RadC